MTVQTYWDYSERQRSKMTEADVNHLLDAELMTRGVLKVVPPVLADETAPAVERTKFFKVGPVMFKTIEEAETFVALHPFTEEHDYKIAGYSDSQNYVAKPVPADQDVEVVQRLSVDQATVYKSTLERYKAACERNAEVRREHEAASKEAEKVLRGVWDDWMRCANLAARHQRVEDTLKSYVEIANGDEAVARAFLLKVFTQEQVDEAAAWFSEE